MLSIWRLICISFLFGFTVIQAETISNEDYLVLNTVFANMVNSAPPDAKEIYSPNNLINVDTVKFKEYMSNVYLTNQLLPLNDSLFKTQLGNDYSKSVRKDYRRIFNRLLAKKSRQEFKLNQITNVGLFRVKKPNYKSLNIGEHHLVFSRIIYNHSKNKACFYYENYCDGMCSFGKLIFLEKRNGIWTVIEKDLIWVA